ncbi:restriction endonuclease [Corynebacterium rouxii]|uniref:restriction endonuclease n=1 Tax=Corynebacterium rouxii TaxID=2719119 RepID=UPI00313B3DB0
MSTDNTPTIDQFRPAVLSVLADGRVVPFRELCIKVADYLGLSTEIRAEQVPSGQARYINRINWACSGLTQAQLLGRPQRGHYAITANGREVESRKLKTYSEKDMLEWPAWRTYQEEAAARKKDDPAGSSIAPVNEELQSPIEVMANNEQAFNYKVETELRNRLQQASPEFFEKAVIKLLWAMGYGGTHGKKKHVGQSNDGGIDGIISQDALGLTNVYIQAKRYSDTNKVGDPEIRNFIGSLDAQGANLGVFITTSSFLPKAQQSAARYRHGRIVLIDGQKLTRYMLNYGVAIQKKQEFTLYEIDEDFFDEEDA